MIGIGALVGFLFGIPRILQQDTLPTDGSTAYNQRVNTNLEQISDWLTKILVGVGLTQMGEVPQKLSKLSEHFSSSLGDSQAFTLALILNSLVLGFFLGYLLTRLFLAEAFSLADRMAAAQKLVDLKARKAANEEVKDVSAKLEAATGKKAVQTDAIQDEYEKMAVELRQTITKPAAPSGPPGLSPLSLPDADVPPPDPDKK